VCSAIEYYPQIFVRQEREIARASNADRYLKTDYLDNEFVRNMPVEVRQKVAGVIEKLLNRESSSLKR
jgi:hypothetical protein